MQTWLGQRWHRLSTEQTRELLGTSTDRGLDILEVGHRQQQLGPNIASSMPPPGASAFGISRTLAQISQPILVILLAVAVVAAVVRPFVEALAILLAVAINVVAALWQERRERPVLPVGAATVLASEATVLRGGKMRRVAAVELVLGDIVLLAEGDPVPADVRLIETHELRIAEERITGSSTSIPKRPEPIRDLEDGRHLTYDNMAYVGSRVVAGRGRGVVTAIGDDTLVANILSLSSAGAARRTPLSRRMVRVSWLHFWAVVGLSGYTIWIALLYAHPALLALEGGLGLVLSALPLGLPAAIVAALALGQSRLARRGASIRRHPVIENLARVSIVCADKARTITMNAMTVKEIVVVGARYELSGAGYEPEGEVIGEGRRVRIEEAQALRECLRAATLCAEASLTQADDGWRAEGAPEEVAFLVAAAKAGLDAATLREVPACIDRQPYDVRHRLAASLQSRGPEGPHVVFVRGDAATILPRCSKALTAQGEVVELNEGHLRRMTDEMIYRGYHVQAFARLRVPQTITRLASIDLTRGLTFLGLQGMTDPAQPEAVSAVDRLRGMGVQVKMIANGRTHMTGAVANLLGLYAQAGGPESAAEVPAQAHSGALTGIAMADLSDEELIQTARGTSVFARVAPHQTLRLVEALQIRGEMVAITGGEADDALALRASDVGVVTGAAPSPLAIEAADMVVERGGLQTLADAVAIGRTTLDNLARLTVWALPAQIALTLYAVVAMAVGLPVPVTPLQAVWVNLLVLGTAGLALAAQPTEAAVPGRPAHPRRALLITRRMVWRTLSVGAVGFLAALALFYWELFALASLGQARTAALNMVAMGLLVTLLSGLVLHVPLPATRREGTGRGLLLVLAALAVGLALQALFTYAPLLNTLLGTVPLPPASWARILLVALPVLLVAEIAKTVRPRRREAGRQA